VRLRVRPRCPGASAVGVAGGKNFRNSRELLERRLLIFVLVSSRNSGSGSTSLET
jgi:hypothetical protein